MPVVAARRELVSRLFPEGIPPLWCPSLTHFTAPGQLDGERLGAHLRHLSRDVRGLLVPGSTGEGWEMSDEDVRRLLEVVLDAVAQTGQQVLIGVLKTEIGAVLDSLAATLSWLRRRSGCADDAAALARSRVVGFTVCPPKGRDVGQSPLLDALRRVLDVGLPIALYQLPQVTENELSADSVQQLADSYANFYLWKDTSGRDRVASAKLDLGGVFLVRGAEGDYAAWPRPGGGPYDGFLLSTANVFARQLHEVIRYLGSGQKREAAELAGRVAAVVHNTFQRVEGFSVGNPFTNANKTLDHLMAFGEAAGEHDPPLLYSGVRLPCEWVSAAADFLREQDLFPARGYLA